MSEHSALDRIHLENTAGRVDREMAATRADARAALECQQCKAIAGAVPPEAQIKILVSEDWDPKQLAFVPRVMNQEQAVASALLASALGQFVKAYGVETAGARLASTLEILRAQTVSYRIAGRILEARSDINARAREQYARGDIAAAHAIEAEPTPDYPGRERDEAWHGGRQA